MSHGLHCRAAVSWVVTLSNRTPRRSSIAANSSSIRRSASRRRSSVPARTSTVNSTTPGMTLTAPGRVLSTPTVPTAPSISRQIRSIAVTASDAAASASYRRCIGTVPAWPARPITSTRIRVEPAIEVTTPTGRSSASSTGPCSMCTSTYPATSSRRYPASSDRVRIEPELAQRLAQAAPRPRPRPSGRRGRSRPRRPGCR